MSGDFATLRFERQVSAPVATLWQAWTAPAARAIWAAPTSAVTVEFLQSEPRDGGRELSICKASGQPDVRCEAGWLELQPHSRSVNYEVISSQGVTQSSALVTAAFSEAGAMSKLEVTVQLSALAAGMEVGYRQGFGAGLDNLAGVAERTMVLQRVIRAPRQVVWGAWMNPETLPKWWGPDGFSCRTKRIDLRSGALDSGGLPRIVPATYLPPSVMMYPPEECRTQMPLPTTDRAPLALFRLAEPIK